MPRSVHRHFGPSRCLVLFLFLVLASSQFALAEQSPSLPKDPNTPTCPPQHVPDSNDTYTVPSTLLDVNHPRSFMRVFERDRRGRLHPIIGTYKDPNPNITTQHRHDTLAVEVDVASRIVLALDRDFIAACSSSLDIDLSIRAQVKSSGGVQNIEVPGYALVGEEAHPVPANLRGISTVIALTEQFRAVWQDARDKIASASELALQRMDPKASSDDLALRAKVLNDPQFLGDYVPRVTAALVAIKPRLLTAANKLSAPENDVSVRGLAAALNLDSDVLKQTPTELVQLFVELERTSQDSSTYSDAARTVDDILRALDDLGGTFPIKSDDLRAILIASLKDTDILVPQTGAGVNDNIVITIQNHAPDSPDRRALVVTARVAEFGLIREISDSAMFIRRLGVTASENRSAFDAAQAAASAQGAPISIETPDEVNFTPAPGVSLTWTYRPRREDSRWGRALQPGAGFNVSFPKFGSTIATFTPSTGSTPAMAEFSDSNEEIDVGAGFVATLFNNALQFTYGWNLTADEERKYFGVGFSFVRIIQAAKGGSKGE